MKAIEQFFLVVLFIMLNKVVLVDETPVCDHSYESYSAVLSFVSVHVSLGGAVNFDCSLWIKSSCVTVLMKAINRSLDVVLFVCQYFKKDTETVYLTLALLGVKWI